MYSAEVTESDWCAFVPDVRFGKYIMEADVLGYDIFSDTISHSEFKAYNVYLMPRKSIELNELTVTTDRSATATQTSGGMLFYLSEKARKMRDPFKAISEIPLLITDITKGSVKTFNGQSPKILIDGQDLNTGIAPLNPSDIISVEVITNPPMRYRLQGYESVVNIKLRKREGPYIWTQAFAEHAVPLNSGTTDINFEVGNPKVSLYGSAGFNYTYNQRLETDNTRTNGDYIQTMNENRVSNSRNWRGSLMLKGAPNEKNYYAVRAGGYTRLSKIKTDGTGMLDNLPNDYISSSREPSKMIEGMAYYKHIFGNNHTIDGNISYFYSSTKSDMWRNETFGDNEVKADMDYQGDFQNVSGQIYYTYPLSNSVSVGAGVNGYYNIQKIKYIGENGSDFNYRNYQQFAYVSVQASLFNKLYFNGAFTNQGVLMDNSGYKRSFWPFGGKAYLKYAFDDRNSVDFSYYFNNTAPGILLLTPFNTSTDPLQITCGNPDLQSERQHTYQLTYNYLYGKWFAYAMLYYQDNPNVIESYKYVNDDGMIVNTYANMGYDRWTSVSLHGNYRLPFGNVFVNVKGARRFFPEGCHNSITVVAGFQFFVKKFTFYGNFCYIDKYTTRYALYTNYKPRQLNLECAYNINDDFIVAVKVDNLAGMYRDKVVTSNGDFHEVSYRKSHSMDIRPTFILRYTFRANAKRRINLGEVLQSKGASIKIAE